MKPNPGCIHQRLWWKMVSKSLHNPQWACVFLGYSWSGKLLVPWSPQASCPQLVHQQWQHCSVLIDQWSTLIQFCQWSQPHVKLNVLAPSLCSTSSTTHLWGAFLIGNVNTSLDILISSSVGFFDYKNVHVSIWNSFYLFFFCNRMKKCNFSMRESATSL